jgi:nucleotide-binding universal stress UspA family protein
MTTASSPAPLLHLVVGYDGSPPASRALDAAVLLLQGRTGRIAVVYIAHLSGIVIEAPVAAAEMEPGFDQIEQELRAQATEQLRERGVPWAFERRQGNIAEELSTVAAEVGNANPEEFVMIVVGSSSSPIHRVAGSVAVGLGRHPPVPLLIVP